MKTRSFLLFAIFFHLLPNIQSQTYLLGPQEFSTDVLIHGSSAPTTVWFAPNYYTPIDYVASGGNPGGYAGFSGNWNDYWGNFIRFPQVNCSGNDTVIMSFDMSHSYFVSQPNDWIRFYLWDQGSGSYKNNVSSVMIDSVESIVNFGANGYGFRFDTLRTWVRVEVKFYLTNVVNKTNVLFYLEPNCYYNNSNVYFVQFDNIGITTNNPVTGLGNNDVSGLSIRPNPADQYFTFHLPEGFFSMQLFDASGKLVRNRPDLTEKSNLQFYTGDLENGLYFLRVFSGNGRCSDSRLIIQH
jgi:hypothetical protein